MGWQNWQQKAAKKLYVTLAEPFHVLTVTLLSILLPLSFLLLARFSCYSYLLTIATDPNSQPAEPLSDSSFLFSFILRSNPAILYLIVSIFSIATLLHGLTGKFNLLNHGGSGSSPVVTVVGESQRSHHLYTAWILLCILQACVGLGVHWSLATGLDGHSFDVEKSLLSRVVFFLGLHETMLYWSRTVVKPVVDDTIFGFARDEKWVQRVVMALSFGGLWWWRLRDEVESLAIAAEAKKVLLMPLGIVDLISWWLYYLTVTIGMLRIVKGFTWIMIILLCRRVRRDDTNSPNLGNIEDKV